ncbi:MAG: hypothetical protein HOQ07_12740 [Sinomonas sp.]|nr:hypothetical protein [Sinomonas sp.]
MEHTAFLALAIIRHGNSGARSALPDAPIVEHGLADRSKLQARARGWLANTLHRLAWALEPEPWLTPETAR